MLYDRSYMKADGRPYGAHHPVLTWLLGSNIALFVVDRLTNNALLEYLALTITNASFPYPWTFITYGFMHSSNFLHIVLNMLILYLLGRQLEPTIGSRRFGSLYFLSVFLGGLLWSAIHAFNGSPGILLGSSAGVYGIVIYLCLTLPNRPTTFLLFFVIPLTLKPLWIVWGLTGIEAVFSAVELLHPSAEGSIANSAHLGGIAAAFISFWMFSQYQPSFSAGKGGITIEPPKWMKRKKATASKDQKFKVNVVTRKEMQAEVDRILDKINKRGFGSLTIEEKETLDRAKEFLKK